MSNWFVTAALWLVVLFWLAAGVVWYRTPASPYQPIGVDTVEPADSPIGGMVIVTRNFVVTRDDTLFVIRTMVKGNCPKTCEIVDLPSSYLEIHPGTYALKREHVLPKTAAPGTWVLKFSIQWEDSLGRKFSMPLPPLTVEVTP